MDDVMRPSALATRRAARAVSKTPSTGSETATLDDQSESGSSEEEKVQEPNG